MIWSHCSHPFLKGESFVLMLKIQEICNGTFSTHWSLLCILSALIELILPFNYLWLLGQISLFIFSKACLCWTRCGKSRDPKVNVLPFVSSTPELSQLISLISSTPWLKEQLCQLANPSDGNKILGNTLLSEPGFYTSVFDSWKDYWLKAKSSKNSLLLSSI